jgi:hypothetical protein
MFSLRGPSVPNLAIWCCFFLAFIIFSHSAAASTISGFVYTKSSRQPLPDIDVELLNNDNQMRNRQKTDGSGRYTFGDLPDGRYTVRVMAFRYDFEDQEAMVEIVTISVRGQGIGNAFMTQDFYMAPRRGSLLETENAVVFAQEVPPQAKDLYDTAVSDLSKSRTQEGVEGLRKAIAVFPKYYSAIHRLGKEMFMQKSYGESAQLFMKAASINEKSATSLYYVGYSLHSLGKEYNKAALVALENALAIAPASLQVLYLTGKIERAERNLAGAEKHLLQAKKLARMPVAEIHSELAQLYANDLKKFDQAANELEAYLKASKLSSEDEKKTKKVISDLRAKAKATPAKTS